MNAAAWFYSQSFHSSVAEPVELPKPAQQQSMWVERWDKEQGCWMRVYCELGEDGKHHEISRERV